MSKKQNDEPRDKFDVGSEDKGEMHDSKWDDPPPLPPRLPEIVRQLPGTIKGSRFSGKVRLPKGKRLPNGFSYRRPR